jgi:hypothetical protein
VRCKPFTVSSGIPKSTVVEVRVEASNNVQLYCGTPENWIAFQLSATIAVGAQSIPATTFVFAPLTGKGCTSANNCNDRGDCDYCYEVCVC